jgi:hypothetical protein
MVDKCGADHGQRRYSPGGDIATALLLEVDVRYSMMKFTWTGWITHNWLIKLSISGGPS